MINLTNISFSIIIFGNTTRGLTWYSVQCKFNQPLAMVLAVVSAMKTIILLQK